MITSFVGGNAVSNGSLSNVWTWAANAVVAAAPEPEPVRGRRGRTRRYGTPAPFPDSLSASYGTLVEAAPPQVVRKLIGEYILKGDVDPKVVPPVAAVDWEALRADTERVVELYDAWIEYVEDEDIITLLLLGDI